MKPAVFKNVNVSVFGKMPKTKAGSFFIECLVVLQLCKLMRVLYSFSGMDIGLLSFSKNVIVQ